MVCNEHRNGHPLTLCFTSRVLPEDTQRVTLEFETKAWALAFSLSITLEFVCHQVTLFSSSRCAPGAPSDTKF